MQIDRREPFAAGHEFGRPGPYEKLTGRLHLEVDPNHPANERIVDLKLAPRNRRGRVEFWTDFFLLRPVDPRRGNRRLFLGINNRGNKLLLGALNNRGGNDPTTLADAGNGFLMRQGYSILWCGWNGDVLPGGGRMLIGLPVARKDGQPITGRIYTEICVDRKSNSEPLCWGSSNVYPAARLDNRTATLTMRATRLQPAVEIPRDRWAFARCEDGKVTADPTHLYVEEGFRPGWLYELVYLGKDPRVTGLGFGVVRDTVSFFRYADADRYGNRNPLSDSVDHAYVFGISQSARFIHHFIYEGFNSDEKKRMVFDGAMPHVGGAGKGFFNHRFAQTTRYGSQHEGHLFPCDFFPLSPALQEDPVTGEEGNALSRASAHGHVPKIFFTETSAEYWCRAASLLHTDVEGKRDVELDGNVRLYYIAGAQHVVSSSPDRGIYRYPRNILDHRPVLRALLVALDRWVSSGQAPPESRYPRIAEGRLVDLATCRRTFPRIPGVNLPGSIYTPRRLDFGPRWATEGIADHVPPLVGRPFRTLVPAVDADGNATAGVRLPDVAVPLATYTGWNLRAAEYGAEGMMARFFGAYFPFPQTAEQRRKTGDPRPSVQERYANHKAYVEKVTEAARQLQQEGFLLEEDAAGIIRIASQKRVE